jgi:hypothetical protein
MTNQDDTKTLEAQLDRDRASLSSTLDALQDRFSPNRLADEAMGILGEHASSTLRSVDRAVRDNPLAVAMVAGGVAWFILGGSSGSGRGQPGKTAQRTEAPQGDMHGQGADGGLLGQIDALQRRAGDKLRALRGGAVSAAGQVRDIAAERAAIVADMVAELKSAFRHGLDGLTEEARARIVSARQKAYAARLEAGRALRRGSEHPAAMIEDHPFVAGCIAMAAGAALAASLPRTRTETRLFGAESDRLLREAARLLAEERDRAKEVAAGLGADVADTAKAAMSTLAETAGERLRDLADPPGAAMDAPVSGEKPGKGSASRGRSEPPRNG